MRGVNDGGHERTMAAYLRLVKCVNAIGDAQVLKNFKAPLIGILCSQSRNLCYTEGTIRSFL